MKYKSIIWDWNGTILNDTSVAFEATNILLQRHDYNTITLDYYRKNIDTPIENFYRKVIDLDKEDMSQLNKEWCILYNELSSKILLHNGVKDVLNDFKNENCNQIVLSAFDTFEILNHAKKFNVEHYFDDILGASNIVMESKLERGKAYMKEHGFEPDSTLYIGDTVYDYDTAVALGVDCILMTCGQQSPELLRKCNTIVCDSFEQLKTII